ncbi:MAG: hypothetical protein RL385_3743 [Pseudomonadota bacterium]|jgi:serine/threonine-protein kinase
MRICPRCGAQYEQERFCPEDGEATQVLAPALPSADPLLGRVIDSRYRVERIIGEGGMGIVYGATHIALNKAVAIKVLRGEMARDADAVQRFAQEAQAASSIGHENIVDIADFGRLPDGNAYFVMELLGGRPLSDLIKLGGALPTADALSVLRQVASALGAAHQRGIVHRDLKPDNIHILRRGEIESFAKVLDFGIAKVGSNSKLTRTGTVFGTPHYMSPEQAAGQSVDARTDTYALGVIMYEMFTGKVPFDADTYMGVLTKHMFEKPAPMESSQAGRPLGALERITLRCLEKKPELRYQTMFELIADLDLAAGGGRPATLTSVLPSAALADALEPRSKSEMELPAPVSLADARAPRRRWVLLGTAALASAGIAGFFALRGPDVQAPAVELPQKAPGSIVASSAADSPPASSSASTAQPPKAALPPPAEVALTSTPSGVTITADGAIIGTTPASLARPVEGSVLLELRADGYQRETVRLDARSPLALAVALRKLPSNTVRRPAPSPVANTPPRPVSRNASGAGQSELVDPWAR